MSSFNVGFSRYLKGFFVIAQPRIANRQKFKLYRIGYRRKIIQGRTRWDKLEGRLYRVNYRGQTP